MKSESIGEAGSEKTWSPSGAFLYSGKAKIEARQKSLDVQWQFKRVSTKGIPLQIVECELRALDISVTGWGDSLLFRDAATKSLAEAWERFWMVHLGNSEPITSSNGFASGRSALDARAAARRELIERALLLQAWQAQTGWHAYRCQSMLSGFLSQFPKVKGWNIQHYLLSESGGAQVLTGLGLHHTFGAVFDATTLTPTKPQIYELKLTRSLLRQVVFQEHLETPPDWQMPVTGEPRDHARFYRDPKHCEAFAFLNKTRSNRDLLTLSALDAQTTELIVDVTELPAVARSAHPHWPELKWGLESVAGQNPWPHPLA